MDRDVAEAVQALDRVAFLLEALGESTYKVRAFRRAAVTVAGLAGDELRARVAAGTLADLPDLGAATAGVVSDVVAGRVPTYLEALQGRPQPQPESPAGAEVRSAQRGDCHTHSDWSDGGSPIAVMARTAAALGHEWTALTDHSPRLTVARGLTADRLREQLAVVARVNADLAPFRLLTGIEVDILDDGSLDQDADLLASLDVVVASVHSKLRMDRDAMTRRMVAAIANPNVDVLGHCTGRLVTGRGRPESAFDAEIVFEACRRFGVAVEVNSRPERLDPPMRLLDLAVDVGCLLAVDTDAHAPGQLTWQVFGCDRVARTDVPVDRIVTTWPVERLLRWTRG